MNCLQRVTPRDVFVNVGLGEVTSCAQRPLGCEAFQYEGWGLQGKEAPNLGPN